MSVLAQAWDKAYFLFLKVEWLIDWKGGCQVILWIPFYRATAEERFRRRKNKNGRCYIFQNNYLINFLRLYFHWSTIGWLFLKFFFFQFFGRHLSFMWDHWYACFHFWWNLSWVSKPGWIAHLYALSMHITKSSSDSPLAWHLLTSLWSAWQPSHSDSHTCKQALAGL